MPTTTSIIEQRCAVCRESLEGLGPEHILLPILNLLRGSQQRGLQGNLCIVCRYRVCGRCVNREASRARDGIVCVRCASSSNDPSPGAASPDAASPGNAKQENP